jgi:hypothetical protein
VLVALPAEVSTVIGPDPPVAGAVAWISVPVEEVTEPATDPNVTVLAEGVVAKFVPVIVMRSPGTPVVGVNPEIVGGDPRCVAASAEAGAASRFAAWSIAIV